MPRTLLAMALLAPLLMGRPALAGPPVGVSGQAVLEKVEDGLRRYLREKEDAKRAQWIQRIATIQEPWVDVVLGTALDDEMYCVRREAARGLADRHLVIPDTTPAVVSEEKMIQLAESLWKERAGDFRRRARALLLTAAPRP